MHVSALVKKVAEEPDKIAVFQEMLNICTLNPTPESLQDLKGCSCLPVRTQSGTIEWCNPSAHFAILDRREYEAVFEGKIRILDFTLEEVHSIRPFLISFGLSTRFLSSAVEEKTTARDNEFDTKLTNDMRKKAYAIYR